MYYALNIAVYRFYKPKKWAFSKKNQTEEDWTDCLVNLNVINAESETGIGDGLEKTILNSLQVICL